MMKQTLTAMIQIYKEGYPAHVLCTLLNEPDFAVVIEVLTPNDLAVI